MSLLSFLGFGNGKIKDVLNKGAIVIDVRTAAEFDRGKAPDSINIPLDRLAINAPRIKGMNRPVIFVCSSGSRSGNAVRILKSLGLKDAYNGGSWEKVAKIIIQNRSR